PRVLTAVCKYTEIQAFGFCNIAWRSENGYKWFARMLDRDIDKIEVTTAGLNHFAWLVEIRDKKSGEDLYPELESRIREKNQGEFKIINKWLDQFGGIMAGVVEHQAEYLPYDEEIDYTLEPPFHGDEAERKKQRQDLEEVKNGIKNWDEIECFKNGSWEHPGKFAVESGRAEKTKFDIINIPNQGYIKELPQNRIVEVPVKLENGKWKGMEIEGLPEGVINICKKISKVHELVAEAAVKGDREIARKAIEIDPAIKDKKTAYKALDKILEAHQDILPHFH
ncbi:MAG: hypothetical protein ACOC1S_04775, partial [bacterium]